MLYIMIHNMLFHTKFNIVQSTNYDILIYTVIHHVTL